MPSSSRRRRTRTASAPRSANIKSRYEHYLSLASKAISDNDPVAAENWHQHAEHFLRMLKAAQSA